MILVYDSVQQVPKKKQSGKIHFRMRCDLDFASLGVCSQCVLLMLVVRILAFPAENTGGGSFQPHQKVLVFRGFAQARQSTLSRFKKKETVRLLS